MFRMLDIDLSERRAEEVEIDGQVRDWIGGRGLGAALLKETCPKAEPFSEENSVFILTSPLVGFLPAVNRIWVVTISPLTNAYTCSSAGGHFAHQLRKAGFEAIRLWGRSDEPVYLEINNGKTKLHSATKLWGLGTYSVTEWLKGRHGGEVLSIGPAGENLVRYACTQFGLHTAGRGGHGAVLGWKRLKAIVVKGKRSISGKNKKIAREMLEDIKKIAEWAEAGGTLSFTPVVNAAHAYPTDNWRQSHFESDLDFPVFKKFIQARHTCYNCPLSCGKIVKTDFGTGDGPEYEIVWAFGANCNQADARLVVEANYLCDDLGLDAINTGSAIAFLKECCEKGLVNYQFENIIELIPKIARREGIGDLLAEGTRLASEKIGAERLSVDVRGMNLPAYDSRVLRGMVFSYILPRYGCHLKAWTTGEELKMRPEERISAEGKAELALKLAIKRAWFDSTCCCSFVKLTAERAAKALSLIGAEIDAEELEEVGRRILKTEIAINESRGINPEKIDLPRRLLEETVEVKGIKTKIKIGRNSFEEMKKEFCELIRRM